MDDATLDEAVSILWPVLNFSFIILFVTVQYNLLTEGQTMKNF